MKITITYVVEDLDIPSKGIFQVVYCSLQTGFFKIKETKTSYHVDPNGNWLDPYKHTRIPLSLERQLKLAFLQWKNLQKKQISIQKSKKEKETHWLAQAIEDVGKVSKDLKEAGFQFDAQGNLQKQRSYQSHPGHIVIDYTKSPSTEFIFEKEIVFMMPKEESEKFTILKEKPIIYRQMSQLDNWEAGQD